MRRRDFITLLGGAAERSPLLTADAGLVVSCLGRRKHMHRIDIASA
jgi:hypothetical protein